MNSKIWRNTIVAVIAAFSVAISVDHALAQKGGRRPILILTKDGQVVVEQIRTVDRARLARKLGRLDGKTAATVLAVLQQMFAP